MKFDIVMKPKTRPWAYFFNSTTWLLPDWIILTFDLIGEIKRMDESKLWETSNYRPDIAVPGFPNFLKFFWVTLVYGIPYTLAT